MLMPVVEFKEPDQKAAQFIAENMRANDVIEVHASGGYSPEGAIEASFDKSDFSAIAWVAGVPCAAFGLVLQGLLSDVGTPWLLGTDQLLLHKREILRYSPEIISSMFLRCSKLINAVHVENQESIRLLKWLGFTIDDPKPAGVHGELFHKFYKLRVD